jgi:hypothetical protein
MLQHVGHVGKHIEYKKQYEYSILNSVEKDLLYISFLLWFYVLMLLPSKFLFHLPVR